MVKLTTTEHYTKFARLRADDIANLRRQKPHSETANTTIPPPPIATYKYVFVDASLKRMQQITASEATEV
jgi:hypothetical protein